MIDVTMNAQLKNVTDNTANHVNTARVCSAKPDSAMLFQFAKRKNRFVRQKNLILFTGTMLQIKKKLPC